MENGHRGRKTKTTPEQNRFLVVAIASVGAPFIVRTSTGAMRRTKTEICSSKTCQLPGMCVNNFMRQRAHRASAAMLIMALSTIVAVSAAEGPSEGETARLTQMQIDALRTPYYLHQYMETSPDDSAFVTLVKEMTAVAIDELKKDAVVMDLQAAEEIAKLIQNGARNIVAEGAAPALITAAESKIKDFTESIVEHGDQVVAPRSAIMPKGGSELVEVHKSAFYIALRSFCPCWPFCQ
jgi:hypothetical protein